jgi:hypothetical protein
MSYLSKWLSLFPKVIGNQTRPEDGIDNTIEYNTDGFPQRMANDPVRYDLENAMASQLFSNDERLKEDIEKSATAASNELATAVAAHNKDTGAHSDIRTKIGTDIGTHNKDTGAHADIRTKIGTDIGTHNKDTGAHADIRTKIGTDISAHNKDATAHTDIRQLVADTVRVTTTANKPASMVDNGLWCEIVS